MSNVTHPKLLTHLIRDHDPLSRKGLRPWHAQDDDDDDDDKDDICRLRVFF